MLAQVLHLIGRGKYSQVYAARHVPSGLQVALKKVNVHEEGQRGGIIATFPPGGNL